MLNEGDLPISMALSDDDDFKTKDEDDVAIPRASLNKFIKDIVPDIRLTVETRELLLKCCHTFIHKLATEANIACSKANRLDAMKLSAYKERAETACQEAKEEIKGRRLMSASYRFKHQDSQELERLMKEQQEIFQQARADFACEHLDRSDLLAASNYAASAVINNYQTEISDVNLPNDSNVNLSNDVNMSTNNSESDTIRLLPTTTGSARLLGPGVMDEDDEDNYD